MKIGTRSVLFGAHQFATHPWFVAAAWWRLYGFPWDPRRQRELRCVGLLPSAGAAAGTRGGTDPRAASKPRGTTSRRWRSLRRGRSSRSTTTPPATRPPGCSLGSTTGPGAIAFDASFDDLRRRLGDRRRLVLTTDSAAAPALPGAVHLGSEGRRHEYAFDAMGTPIPGAAHGGRGSRSPRGRGDAPGADRGRGRGPVPRLARA